MAAFAAVIPVASAEAQTGQLNPTHYWTYHIDNVATSADPVEAGDQFVPLVNLYPLTLQRLLNPTWKTHGPVVHAPSDTVTHYDWWDVPNRPEPRTVIIDNQFDTNLPIQIYELDFLLTPTRKSLTPSPLPPITDKNHYLCYRAQGSSPGLDVILRDQFHEQGQLVASLTYFCNPCWKRHSGVYYPIQDTVTHLALYRLEIPGFGPRYPYLTDQFVNNWYTSVRQYPDEYLVVPTYKHEPTSTNKASWGRIKATYQ
jgi:hypothetical protein